MRTQNDTEQKNRLKKKAHAIRKQTHNWSETSSTPIWNLFCYSEIKTFRGFDPYWERPASREIKLFAPHEPTDLTPVILIPPTGGMTTADQILATQLAHSGFKTFILTDVEGWKDKSPEITRHDRQSIQTIAALKELQQWLQSPVAVIGSSLGSLYALQAFGNDPHVEKMILVAGGENFADIMTDSKLPLVSKLKDERKKIYHLKDDESYRRFIKKHFALEPSLFIEDEHHSQKYLIFTAQDDKVLPIQYQRHLIEDLPRAKKIKLGTGHFLTIVRAYLFNQKEIIDFLKGP